jgi:hypothetical protein
MITGRGSRSTVIVLLSFASAGALVGCESRVARQERARAWAHLSTVEEAITEKLSPGASETQVRALLAALDVPCTPHLFAGEMIAYLGEWQGPFFRRGLHLVFYFDEHGALVRYEAREVEGS